MKRVLHVQSALALIILLTASATIPAAGPSAGPAGDDEAAVRQALQYYIDGQAAGDGS